MKMNPEKDKESPLQLLVEDFKNKVIKMADKLLLKECEIHHKHTSELSDVKSELDEKSKLLTEYKTQYKEVSEAYKKYEYQKNKEVEELNQEISNLRRDVDLLEQEIKIINKSSIEKEELAKKILEEAEMKITQLTKYKVLCEKVKNELNYKLDCVSNNCETTNECSNSLVQEMSILNRSSLLQEQPLFKNDPDMCIIDSPTDTISVTEETKITLANKNLFFTTFGDSTDVSPQQAQQITILKVESNSSEKSLVDYYQADPIIQQKNFVTNATESTLSKESDILESPPSMQMQAIPQQQNNLKQILTKSFLETAQKNPKSFQPAVCATNKRISPEIPEPDLNSKPKKSRKESLSPEIREPNLNSKPKKARKEIETVKSISITELQVCIFILKSYLYEHFKNFCLAINLIQYFATFHFIVRNPMSTQEDYLYVHFVDSQE